MIQQESVIATRPSDPVHMVSVSNPIAGCVGAVVQSGTSTGEPILSALVLRFRISDYDTQGDY